MTSLPDWKRLRRLDPAMREAMVQHLADAGLSAEEIAKRFRNCTRSAVIGLAYRMRSRGIECSLRCRPWKSFVNSDGGVHVARTVTSDNATSGGGVIRSRTSSGARP